MAKVSLVQRDLKEENFGISIKKKSKIFWQ